MAVYKPARRGAPYKHKMIQRKDPDTELRMLLAFHGTQNIPTMINLIEETRGSCWKAPLCVYAMHLMELSERSSAISMVHKARRNGLPFWNKAQNDQDQMVIAFEAYQQLSAVTVRPMTAISPLDTIHEDICTSAHQKRAAVILLPFHKHQRLDGTMESLGHSFQLINQRVLRHAPCSVAIIVDRGLGGTTQVSASNVSYAIVIPFFGGSDDREALALGVRMAEHPGIILNVVKFTIASSAVPITQRAVPEDSLKNDEAIFSKLAASKNDSIVCEERVVASDGDVVSALKSMNKCNLFVIGRNPPTAPVLMDKAQNDCPELGPVGNYLASSDFSTTTSVLVVQQYDPKANLHPLVEEETVSIVPDKSVESKHVINIV